ncbi:hypothetical protein [Oceanibaculum indicum]|uniref:Uncharacterized protein n=1 Tax=Oceanibaculum indicum TaxID=526216 RepID=A0A420WQI6_9PROT|nr:hypothetical protein [Oceanibaculum indicum]RKQ73293.1 hypothetical protein BCL74_1079 [Oceanibaculum indicum]
MLSRRRLLETSMLTAVAALVPGFLFGRAHGFSVEEAPLPVQQLRLQACTEQQRHKQLVEEVLAQVRDAGTAVPETERQALLAAFDCPYCGCRLDPKFPPIG